MTRHSANHIPFDSRPRQPFRRFDAGNDSVRVVLVAIHRNPLPAAFLGSHPLQRLQVLLSAPGEEIEVNPMDTLSRMTAGAPPQLLPQMPATNGGLALRPRLVQGEILSDDDGRLYEKIGRHIRPLQRLFSGPRGEVLELPVEAQTERRVAEPSPQAPAAGPSNQEAQAKIRAEAPAEHRQSPNHLSSRPPQPPMQTHGPTPRRQPPRNMGGFAAPPSVVRNVPIETIPSEGAIPNSQRQPPLSTNSMAGGAASSRNGGLKTAIPEQWIKPWEFQISREEALYDMRAAAISRTGLLAFIRSLTNWFGHRAAWREAWRKWQALLAGKSFDEQLWAVRPPRGTIGRPAVRDWALRTLERAGYDTRVMLVEWEIYWRRKGL
ncbi:MAG TPA: hypothetical protein VFV58_32395 [Blastocatellia bacterium]|jgi:hypothetical protein|nr:hypothetical protein [Blastocatellia bacterium]